MTVPILSVLVAVPLLGAMLLTLVPATAVRARRALAGGAAGLTVVASWPLWTRFDAAQVNAQFVERGPAIGGAQYIVGVDGFSALLVLVVAVVGLAAVLLALPLTSPDTKPASQALLAVEGAALATLVAQDLVLFCLAWAATGVSASILARVWGGDGGGRAARRLLAATAVSTTALAAGAFALGLAHRSATNTWTFDLARLAVFSPPAAQQTWIFAVLCLAFGVQLAMVPASLWAPDVRARASLGGPVVLAAALLPLGLYGFVRVALPILPDAARAFRPALAALVVGSLVYAAWRAMRRPEWGRLLTLLAVVHASLVVVGLQTLVPAGFGGGLMHTVNLCIWLAVMALVFEGLAHHRAKAAVDGGSWRATPAAAVAFAVVAVSAIGIPFSSGFASQWPIVQSALDGSPSMGVVAAAASALGAACLYRLWRVTRDDVPGNGGSSATGWTRPEIVAAAPLVALTVWMGVSPEPFRERLRLPAAKVLSRVNPASLPPEVLAECTTPGEVTPGLGGVAADTAGANPFIEPPCADGTAAPK